MEPFTSGEIFELISILYQGIGFTLLLTHFSEVLRGRDARRREQGGVLDPADGMAGLHPECLGWLREREIALLGSDGISDPMPGVGTPNWPFPIHQIGITGMGLHLIDNLALGELAQACSERGRWAFLFTVGVLRVPGGTGCPVNPIALL